MIKNYFKIAFRSLVKYKTYTFINVLGLAVGLACCLLILLFIKDEWTFDAFHSKADQIYRAYTIEAPEGREAFTNTTTPFPLADALQSNLPEVLKTTRYNVFNVLTRTEGNAAINENVGIVAQTFFEIFDFELLSGKREALLTDLNSTVITENIAQKYFGEADPLGKELQVFINDQYQRLVVKGVLKNLPTNSSFQFGILVSQDYEKLLYNERALASWFNINAETYVLLKENTSLPNLEPKIKAMLKTALGEEYTEGSYKAGLQPLTDIHLNRDFPQGIAPVSDKKYAYILSGVAILVLVIACLNFMTLSIGQSVSRSKEVGIRKVNGAKRQQLIAQFLSEALIISLFAIALGLLFANLALPFFNQLAQKELVFEWNTFIISCIFALIAVVSLVAGSYPALLISGLQPIEILKGNIKLGAGGNRMRVSMVVAQLAFSIFLISATLILKNQFNYLQNKNLGFQKEHLIAVPFAAENAQRLGMSISKSFKKGEILKKEFEQVSHVQEITLSSHTFGNGQWLRVGYASTTDKRERFFFFNPISANYVKTMKMKIVQGRDFDANNPADTLKSILVNEAFVKEFGLKNPIGATIPDGKFENVEIIGIVEDFNYSSLHTQVAPLVMSQNITSIFSGVNDISINTSPIPKLIIRIDASASMKTIDDLKLKWAKLFPEEPFNFSFMEEALNAQYKNEENLSKIATSASLLAISLSMFGLFGLVSLLIESRVKEIGIRKVLGASMGSIVLLLSKDFVRWCIFASILAFPFAYWLMNKWLEDFAYKIDIGAEVFLISIALILITISLTVSFKTIKAAMANPVKSLRSE
jgi:putative ABC transport system permease protein